MAEIKNKVSLPEMIAILLDHEKNCQDPGGLQVIRNYLESMNAAGRKRIHKSDKDRYDFHNAQRKNKKAKDPESGENAMGS